MLQKENDYSRFSDEELFALVKSENRYAFNEIYNRYWLQLINTAYKSLQSLPKSEDIVQDIFTSLYLKKDTLEFTISLRAYLHKALKFNVLNEFRSRSVRNAYKASHFFTDYCKNDFAERLEAKELNAQINKTIGDLPGKCREVFLLSRNEDYSYKQISANMGISVSTVEKHMVKALKVLKGNLKSCN